MEWFSSNSTILTCTTLVLLFLLTSFIQRGLRQRAFYKTVPCPPHSLIWGHLRLIGETMREVPPNLHFQQLMVYIGQKYNMPPVFYLDMWPVSYPIMLSFEPGVAVQVTQTTSLPKHPVNAIFLTPLVGSPSVVTAEGAEWKMIRSIIKPGLSPSYLSTLTPIILKHVSRFTTKLSLASQRDVVFLLQDYLQALTFDVISEVVLGVDMDSQRNSHPLAYHFSEAVKNATVTTTSANLPLKYSKRVMQWYHTYRQSLIIADFIKQRWLSQQSESKSNSTVGRAAIDLFLRSYQTTTSSSNNLPPYKDKAFMKIALANTKSLLLGGHDTTSSSLSWAIALLALNPDALSRLRAEHDQVFSTVESTLSSATHLSANPSLLSSLPYTTAVIKETTRMYPAASTTRISLPSFHVHPTHVQLNDNKSMPISNQQIWINHYGIGQRADLWPSPHVFIPERHLPHPPHPYPKDAWRAFEKGPRACAGLELAMNEMKLVLIETMRRFDFTVSYDSNALSAPPGFGGGEGVGEKMYQVMEFTAKPVGHMPMRVRERQL